MLVWEPPNPPNKEQVCSHSLIVAYPCHPRLVWHNDDARLPPPWSIWELGSTTARRHGSRCSLFSGASVVVEIICMASSAREHPRLRTRHATHPMHGKEGGQNHACYIMASKVSIAARILDSAIPCSGTTNDPQTDQGLGK